MRFGLIYELQLPRPWQADSEHRMVQHALAEVEVADRLGFDYVWANEHHFLEEYSHNSAPEVFLAAAAGRTRQIHVGHGVVLSPPGYNPPAHVAERIAMLDLVSSGRAEWGTGSSASRAELEGFNVDAAQKKLMWAEARGGGEEASPCRTRRSPARRGGLPVLRFRARPPLRLWRAHSGRDECVGAVRAGARRDATSGRQRDRHARAVD